MKKYSREYTVKTLQEALRNPERLYKRSCINWSGKIDSGIYYAEIISEMLLNSDILDNPCNYIQVIPRKDYKIGSHNVSKRGVSNREEEIFAKILNQKRLGDLGQIIDYQIPLKSSKNDEGVGKIDLVSFKGNTAYIIELKYADNAETLLKTTLEIWTYYYQLNKNSFLDLFKENANIENIKKAVLLVIGCKAYEEAKDLDSGNRKNLSRLIKKLDVDIFLLDGLTRIKCS